jgi:hypothetical protein
MIRFFWSVNCCWGGCFHHNNFIYEKVGIVLDIDSSVIYLIDYLIMKSGPWRRCCSESSWIFQNNVQEGTCFCIWVFLFLVPCMVLVFSLFSCVIYAIRLLKLILRILKQTIGDLTLRKMIWLIFTRNARVIWRGNKEFWWTWASFL